MGYRVEYQAGKVDEREVHPGRFPVLLGACLLAFLVLVNSLWPQGWRTLRQWLIPGNPVVTVAALENFAEEKLRVIPRAIEREKFDPAKLDGNFVAAKRAEWGLEGFKVVMGLGRITQLKGYDVLIRALAHLHRTHRAAHAKSRDWKLVIVGEAEALRKDYEAELRALVKSLGVEEQVVFAGAQSKVAECLSLADVVVSANWRKPEAFGRSMAEALAMDRPVVATAFGGALDIVEDGVNGALVPPDPQASDVDRAMAFANAIRRVAHAEHGDLRAPALEKFAFARMAAQALAVYAEFAEGARA